MSVALLNTDLAGGLSPEFLYVSAQGVTANNSGGPITIEPSGGYTCSQANSGMIQYFDFSTGAAGITIDIEGNDPGVTSKHIFVAANNAGASDDVTINVLNGGLASGIYCGNYSTGYRNTYAMAPTANGWTWQAVDGGANVGILQNDCLEITVVGTRSYLKWTSSYICGIFPGRAVPLVPL